MCSGKSVNLKYTVSDSFFLSPLRRSIPISTLLLLVNSMSAKSLYVCVAYIFRVIYFSRLIDFRIQLVSR